MGGLDLCSVVLQNGWPRLTCVQCCQQYCRPSLALVVVVLMDNLCSVVIYCRNGLCYTCLCAVVL